MTGNGIGSITLFIREAFEGDMHALAENLAGVRAGHWATTVAGGGRSVRDIAEYVAIAKHLFVEHTFGPAQHRYGDMLTLVPEDREALVAWMREAQDALLEHASQLSDADLERPCRLHWGGTSTVGRVLRTAAKHDIYHAGEINHLRALLVGDDQLDVGMRRPQ